MSSENGNKCCAGAVCGCSAQIDAVPRVSTSLTFSDTLGRWKSRWGIGRMHYIVKPSLYAVGNPSPESPVLVSANYKMSFDCLRSRLTGRDLWILVLDTKGINVWCAAGKGTFGTVEIVQRINLSRLKDFVTSRTLILPQLGAPGVAAHRVKRATGFDVVYGPIRARDLPAFLDAGMKASPGMRRMTFPIGDRMNLIPMEIVGGMKYALIAAVAFFLISGLSTAGYSIPRAMADGTKVAFLIIGIFLLSAISIPALLPFLPGRPFSLKGFWIGLLSGISLWLYSRADLLFMASPYDRLSLMLLFIAIAGFVGLNFTGASTYTSLSGVRREMRVAVPAIAVVALIGTAGWIFGLFF